MEGMSMVEEMAYLKDQVSTLQVEADEKTVRFDELTQALEAAGAEKAEFEAAVELERAEYAERIESLEGELTQSREEFDAKAEELDDAAKIVESLTTKLENPAYKDANTEGLDNPIETGDESELEERDVLSELASLKEAATDDKGRRAYTKFQQDNLEAINEARNALRTQGE